MKEIAKMSIGELAAFVCSHLQKQGIEVVLTGGGCVEIYSSEKYSSLDLDFIENVPVGGRKLGKVMEEIQFFRKDRYFVHPDTRYFIEFPVGPLAVWNSDIRNKKFRLFKSKAVGTSLITGTTSLYRNSRTSFSFLDKKKPLCQVTYTVVCCLSGNGNTASMNQDAGNIHGF